MPSPTTAAKEAISLATIDEPSRNTNKVATINKGGKRLEVRGKLKRACDRMVWQGEVWNVAAENEKFTVAAMRKALERPHVRAYLLEQKQVFRASISTRNIFRLAELRDQDDNRMASLGAIKVLEESAESASDNAPVRTPGIAIQIINQGPSDGKPLETLVTVGRQRIQQESGDD